MGKVKVDGGTHDQMKKIMEVLHGPQETSKTIYLGQKILHFDVPEGLIEEINTLYEKKFSTLESFNKNLAGKISREHRVDKELPESIKRYFEDRFNDYLMAVKIMRFAHPASAWINEMVEHEYNPLHLHTGKTEIGISSVLCLKKPDDYGVEIARKDDPVYNTNGRLELVGNGGGMFGYNQHKVDLEVGDQYVFPYDIKHGVYPFTGNGVRRTLSYNCDMKR